MSHDVFISVGITSTPEQESFIHAVEDHLRANGLNPRAFGRTDWSSKQPLTFIQELMSQCAGTVIIAFERSYIERGTEKRGGPAETELAEVKLSTVWNQIEAAMAYDRGQPLLVMVEEGLRQEGLLERGYDWWVQQLPLTASSMYKPEFAGVFADWKRRVDEYSQTKAKCKVSIDPETLTLSRILGALTPKQLWGLLGTLAAAVAAIASVAYKLGKITGASP